MVFARLYTLIMTVLLSTLKNFSLTQIKTQPSFRHAVGYKARELRCRTIMKETNISNTDATSPSPSPRCKPPDCHGFCAANRPISTAKYAAQVEAPKLSHLSQYRDKPLLHPYRVRHTFKICSRYGKQSSVVGND